MKVTYERDWLDIPEIKEYESLTQFFNDHVYHYCDRVSLVMDDGTSANWDKDEGWTSENRFFAKILMIDEVEYFIADDDDNPFLADVILAIVREERTKMNFRNSCQIKEGFRSKDHLIYEFVELHEKVKI